jgi:hypothetical protein
VRYYSDIVLNFNVPIRIFHADGVIELSSTIQSLQPNVNMAIFRPREGYLKYNQNGVIISDPTTARVYLKPRIKF